MYIAYKYTHTCTCTYMCLSCMLFDWPAKNDSEAIIASDIALVRAFMCMSYDNTLGMFHCHLYLAGSCKAESQHGHEDGMKQ